MRLAIVSLVIGLLVTNVLAKSINAGSQIDPKNPNQFGDREGKYRLGLSYFPWLNNDNSKKSNDEHKYAEKTIDPNNPNRVWDMEGQYPLDFGSSTRLKNYESKQSVKTIDPTNPKHGRDMDGQHLIY